MLNTPVNTTPDTGSAPPTRSRVNWRQEYIHLTVGLMMACWLAGWVALTLNWFLEISLATTFGLSAVHLLGSIVLVRWLLHRRTSGNLILATVALVMWIAAGITVLLMPSLARTYGGTDHLTLTALFYIDRQTRVPGGPLVVLWVLFFWWRGYQLGNVYTTLVRASFGMRLGLLGFLWGAILSGHALREDILALVPLFFFCGLLASSLARADSLNLDQSRHSAFGRGWILSLTGIALVVTLGGYIAALWLSGMNTREIAEVLSTLGEGALTLLFLILSPMLLLAQVGYNLLKAALPDRLHGPILETGSGVKNSNQDVQAPWLSQLFELFGNALAIALVILVVISLLAFIWFLFVARGQRQEYEDEERESLGTGEVVGGLRQALADRWRRLADLLGSLRQFGLGRGFFTALTIRRIYARMEHLAQTRGYPRIPSETPYEYRQQLHQAFPGQEADFQQITEAYVAVRYGETPEDPADLAAVRAAWSRLNSSPDPAGSS